MSRNLNLLKSVVLGAAISIGSTSVSLNANNIGKILNNDTSIKTSNGDSASEVTKLNEGESLEIIGHEGEYYKVAFEELEEAFVLDKYISVIEAEAFVVADVVKVRQFANKESISLGELKFGDKIIVTGLEGEFYRISYKGKDAFVHSDFVIGDMVYSVQRLENQKLDPSEMKTYATVVSESSLNLRKSQSEDSESLDSIPRNTILDVLSINENWVEVKFGEKQGFVQSNFVVVQTGVKPEDKKEKSKESNTNEDKDNGESGSTADEVISFAKKFLGTPYSWGGTNLNKGVDCSGFVYSVMKNFGVRLNRTSSSQASNGSRVSKANLKKGDLVFFDTSGSNNGRISHVGIYMGGGKFIHSSSGKQWGVTISSLSEAYYVRTYVTASRVIS